MGKSLTLLVFLMTIATLLGESSIVAASSYPDKADISLNPISQNNKADDVLYPFVNKDELLGYMNREGNVVIIPQYVMAKPFHEGLAWVVTDADFTLQSRFIDATGKTVFLDSISSTDGFWEGFAISYLWPDERSNTYTFFDRYGNRYFDTYLSAQSFSEGVAIVQVGGATDPEFDDIPSQYKFITTSGSYASTIIVDDAHSFHNGYASVKLNGEWGIIDKNFQWVISAQYEDIGDYSNGLIPVKKNGKWGAIDLGGNIVVNFLYDKFSSYSDGYASVSCKEKYGFIDTAGKTLISLKYDDAKSFSEGFAAVQYQGKWGFVNTNGKLVIGLNYDSVGAFYNGLAAIQNPQNANPQYYITSSGEKVTPKV